MNSMAQATGSAAEISAANTRAASRQRMEPRRLSPAKALERRGRRVRWRQQALERGFYFAAIGLEELSERHGGMGAGIARRFCPGGRGEHTRDAWSGFFAFLRRIRLEGRGTELAVRRFQENFHAAFRLFDLFLAFLGELDALLEE